MIHVIMGMTRTDSRISCILNYLWQQMQMLLLLRAAALRPRSSGARSTHLPANALITPSELSWPDMPISTVWWWGGEEGGGWWRLQAGGAVAGVCVWGEGQGGAGCFAGGRARKHKHTHTCTHAHLRTT